jgi:hypothetical protein
LQVSWLAMDRLDNRPRSRSRPRPRNCRVATNEIQDSVSPSLCDGGFEDEDENEDEDDLKHAFPVRADSGNG